LPPKWARRTYWHWDTDPIAVRVTDETLAANGVADRVTAQTGSLDSLIHAATRFDLALVNILAKVIIAMCGQGLGSVLRPAASVFRRHH